MDEDASSFSFKSKMMMMMMVVDAFSEGAMLTRITTRDNLHI